MTANETGPGRILAVLLGAGWYAEAPSLAQGPSFENSARDVREYLLSSVGMGLPRTNIRWLFDDGRSAVDQLRDVGDFLERRVKELKAQSTPASDLIVYYLGHGMFCGPGNAYHLAIRATEESREGLTSIRFSDLAQVIKGRAGFLRNFLILDCCFAGAAYLEFESGALQASRAQVFHEMPARGTALLCAASAKDAALAPRGLSRTMFSDSLLKSLETGHPGLGAQISLFELGNLVKEHLKESFPDRWVHPELHCPDQREGEVAAVGLFPNPAPQPVPAQAAPAPVMRNAGSDRELDANGAVPASPPGEQPGYEGAAVHTPLAGAANPLAGALPREIWDLIENPAVLARAHAADRLKPLLAGSSEVLARAAREALERLRRDPEPIVARAGAAALSGSQQEHIFDPTRETRSAASIRGRSTAEIAGIDLLPMHLRVLLDHPEAEVRLPAVKELARLLIDQSAPISAAGRRALEWLKDDPDGRVSQGALTALGTHRRPGDIFRDAPDCPEMVMIPPGSFLMGSPDNEPGRSDDEGPVHEVSIDYALAVATGPVTCGQWQRYLAESRRMGSTGAWGFNVKTGKYEQRKEYCWNNPGFPQQDDHPVVCIAWQEATEYAVWLSAKTGHHYRLLSEAEYEYVNRAGTRSAYWWGDSTDGQWRHANGADAALQAKHSDFSWCIPENDGFAYTSPVGHFPANPFGLHDTTGNVWSWTQDRWHDNYNGAPGNGGAWESGSAVRRVVRGGSWIYNPGRLRSANRNWNDVATCLVGFRVAMGAAK